MASTTVTFSCDSATDGDFTGTYSCRYGNAADGPVGVDATQGDEGGNLASYTVDCTIRPAESDLDASPAPGSTLNIAVPMNGSGETFVNFSEVNDEGMDATIDSCTLTDGANFMVLTAFPLTVPSGGTAQVQIVGTDPADGNTKFTDTLTCVGTDSEATETVTWELVMTVQTAAIPTLSTWGLLAMILAMFGFGGTMIRRKVRS
jgi:hypothetical protein